MNQLLPLTESEALFAPFQDPWLSRRMDFALVPAGGVGFRNEINWDSVYVKWGACPLGEVAGGLEIPIIAANLQRLILPRQSQVWAVLRTSKSGKHALLVAHTFGKPFPKSVEIPLPGAGWKVEEAWPAKAGLKSSLKGKRLNLELAVEFRATVTTLRRS